MFCVKLPPTLDDESDPELRMHTFDIYFVGEMLPDADPATVRAGVAGLFKMQGDAVERLFSGKPLRVKRSVDVDTAGRYRERFREVGALVQIVPTGDPPPAARAPVTNPEVPAVATATTATEDEVAVEEIVYTDSPDPEQQTGGDIGLAEPGAIIDPSTPPPPADIDTSALEALPPNTGSLEDCQVDKPHRPIPDISHLKLVDD